MSPMYWTSLDCWLSGYGYGKVCAVAKIGHMIHVRFEVIDKQDEGWCGSVVNFGQSVIRQREKMERFAR